MTFTKHIAPFVLAFAAGCDGATLKEANAKLVERIERAQKKNIGDTLVDELKDILSLRINIEVAKGKARDDLIKQYTQRQAAWEKFSPTQSESVKKIIREGIKALGDEIPWPVENKETAAFIVSLSQRTAPYFAAAHPEWFKNEQRSSTLQANARVTLDSMENAFEQWRVR